MVALSAAGGAPVRAADLPFKAPPAVPAWSWDGFYLGGHAGAAWMHDPLQEPLFPGQSTPSLGNINSPGVLAGFQAGANWQRGAWLTGLEFDISATSAHGTSSAAGTGPVVGGTGTESVTLAERAEMLGSGRLRFGYLPRPDLLLYGTAGLAWARVDLSSNELMTGPASLAATTTLPTWRFGWVAGVGAEMRLANTNWLGRLEYLHYDFGDASNSTVTTIGGADAGTLAATEGPMTVDVVRAGLSYKFGGAGPAGDVAGSGPFAWASPAASSSSTAPWNWAGPYAGVHAGYGGTRDRLDEFFGNGLMHGIDGQGGLGGFQAGANWQSGRLVGGLESDLSVTNIHGQNGAAGTSVTPFVTTAASGTVGEEFRLLGSARARFGYLVSPTTLLYGTGGLAWTQITETVDSVQTTTIAGFPVPTTTTTIGNASAPTWRFGWVAGVGAEQRIGATNWTGRLEYLHYDFGETGSAVSTVTTGGVTTVTPLLASNHMTADVVRAGASYRLVGDGGAAPARFDDAPTPTSWNGFYLGVHGGGGVGNDQIRVSGTVPLSDVHSAGWLAGGQAGANWQAGRWLAGLEIDASTTGIKGSTSGTLGAVPGSFTSKSLTDKFELLGSARARLGWLAWPNLVVYGSGGLAWAQVLQATATESSGFGIDSTTAQTQESWRWGWAAGLGAETRIHGNWLGRLEYLHYDFGKFASTTQSSGGSTVIFSENRLTTDVLRVGLSYQLN